MVLTGKKDNVDEVLKHIPVNPVPNKTYRNVGKLRFQDVGAEWGLGQPSFSNGAAYGDLDNDGDLDLIVNNENMPSFIYRNNSREQNGNHFIGVQLKGDSSNPFAIGSKIKIHSQGQVFYRELIPSRGFQSSMDYKQIIGTGKVKTADSLIVIWPDQSTTKLNAVAADSLYMIDKKTSAVNKGSISPNHQADRSVLFDSLDIIFDKHREDDYVDFYYERNIPQMLSREGPRAAVADVNGDGLDDVYIGGTKGYPGQLYVQKNGVYSKSAQNIFHIFSEFEDGACIFFDADKDGDMDLFVGPAGNNQPEFSRAMQSRLLLNDGKGNFSLKGSAFPKMGVNTAAVVAEDFDRDGDIDLFVGGRAVSRDYGTTPASFVFINDGKGNFADIAAARNPEIAKIGMVTAATTADINGDDRPELIIAGEWMSPRIFSFSGDRFTELKSNLTSLQGWWQSVTGADLDKDGKMDLVLGNIGDNFYLRPTAEQPVKLWMADFDGSGDVDKLLTRRVDGKDKPVFLKNDIQDQVPGIKKENLKHHEFATKSIQELFTEKAVSKSDTREFNYSSSIIALNRGDGKFEIIKLPLRGQLSSVNAIVATDLNNDGWTDLVTGGNRSGFPPQLQKLDASFGDVFINNGKGNFEWKGNLETGLKVGGEVRDIKMLNLNQTAHLLFLRNDEFPKMFRINRMPEK